MELTPLNMPQARMATHPNDPEAQIDHVRGFGGHMPHTHVIKESWRPADKNALGDHIDRYHAPIEGGET